MAKTKAPKRAPFSRKSFTAKAPKPSEVMATLANKIDLDRKDSFSSGGYGYYGGGKMVIEIDGKEVKCQVSCNIVVVDSKHCDETGDNGPLYSTDVDAETNGDSANAA